MTLHCGDNLAIMRDMESESIDLIYADPPFYTQRDFVAFNDKFDSMDAYIRWLRTRLEECYRVLKQTGQIYCHLDWHAVHYVKVMCDEIFGYNNFRNEIVWCYTGPSSPGMKQFARKHDNILVYSKGNTWAFNVDDVRLPYKASTLKNEGKKTGFTTGNKDLVCTLNPKGKFPEDWWQIPVLAPASKERLGYPTQKSEKLLERIIKASSNPGDVILDPFCGCGTAVAVAEKLNRRWIGIDVSPTSCKLMVKRLNTLTNERGESIQYIINDSDILDMPMSEDDLRKLPHFEFQNWAVTQLGERQEVRKSGDGGIDGWTFTGDPIQVKQSDSVGRNTVKMLVHDTMRIGKTNGIIVAFSFGKGAYKEAEEAKAQFGIDIELKTVEDMV